MVNVHPIKMLALTGALGFGITPALGLAASVGDFTVETRDKVALQAQPFALSEVRLLDGPFKLAQDLDRQYLLSLDADRLLYSFRVNAGLPSRAKPYGGWEAPSCELRGHSVGHYLSACSLMFASTGDARFKERGERVVAGMAQCQAKFPSGYLSAYGEEEIDRVEAGKGKDRFGNPLTIKLSGTVEPYFRDKS